MKPLVSVLLLVLLISPQSAFSQTLDPEPRGRGDFERNSRQTGYAHRRMLRNLEERGFFGPQTLPNWPDPVTTVLPDWAPTETALLSMQSIASVLGIESSYRQYADLVAGLISSVEVIILYPEKEQTLLGELMERLEKELGILPFQDRLSFYPAPGPSMWIRDNGPIFALDGNNHLAALDFSARPFVDEDELWYTTPSEISGVEWEKEKQAFEANRTRERLADALPVALNRHLRLHGKADILAKRPPISLQGGDFITDGNGNFFISQETVQSNGGDEQALTAAFKRYVAEGQLHFLFPLPGNTPKHLDMVMKFVDANTVLLLESPTTPATNEKPYMRRLRFEIESVLAYNRRYLEDRFPHLNIIGIPLLPLVDEAPARILNRLRWRIIARVCELNRLDILVLLNGTSTDSQFQQTEDALYAAIAADLAYSTRLETIEDLQTAALHYLKMDIHSILQTNIPFQTIYRSPANAIHLQTVGGRELIILPRFAPREGEHLKTIAGWEKVVESAYRKARPDAIIKWVNADAAADLQGGLHCMFISFPKADRVLRP